MGKPVWVDHYRQVPYDLLITLPGGHSLGILRQRSTLPSPNRRYRLRTIESLPWEQRPTATLIIANSDQANRRTTHTPGHPMEHQAFCVATEGELLARSPGGSLAAVWKRHGHPGENRSRPLDDIIGWKGRRLDRRDANRLRLGMELERKSKPHPDTLYSSHPRAVMPQPVVGEDVALLVMAD